MLSYVIKKVKQRAGLGSAWTQPTACILTRARSWRLFASWGLLWNSSSSFKSPSMQALSMQEEHLKVGHYDISSIVGFQEALNKSLCFYCKSTTFNGKISKTSFPSNWPWVHNLSHLGPFCSHEKQWRLIPKPPVLKFPSLMTNPSWHLGTNWKSINQIRYSKIEYIGIPQQS